MRVLYVVSLLVVCFSPWLCAQNYWNVAGPADWTVGGNWSPAAPGGPTGVAHVRNGGSAEIVSAAANLTHLAVARDGDGTLILDGGSVTSGTLQVGWGYGTNSTGTFLANSGTINLTTGWNQVGAARSNDSGFNSTGVLGGQASASGTVILSGATVNMTGGGSNRFPVGYVSGVTNADGTGTLIVNSGSLTTANQWFLGVDESSGTGSAHGWYTQSGGTVTFGQGARAGQGNNGNATLLLTGGTLNFNTFLTTGLVGATTVFDVTGGSVNFGTELSLGEGAGGGTAVMNISGASIMNVGGIGLHIGRGTGATGTLNIQGGTVTSTGSVQVGGYSAGGVGYVNQSGGTFTANGAFLELAQSIGSSGTYLMTGGVLNHLGVGGTMSVGARGNAYFDMSGNSTINGSSLSIAQGLNGQTATQATFRQQSGAVNLTSIDIGANATGTYSLEGGALRVNTITVNSGDTFSWSGGTMGVFSQVGSSGAIDFSQPIGPAIMAGTVLNITGAGANISTVASGNASVLDLGGLYLNSGVRQNILDVSGNLNLAAADDTLIMGGSAYLLRPFGFFTEDYGTIPLVSVGGSMTGVFETFVAPVTDGKGWNQSAFAVSSAASLDINTWWLEQTSEGVFFHYRVQGAVPEPGTLGLLVVGAVFLRSMRVYRVRHAQ